MTMFSDGKCDWRTTLHRYKSHQTFCLIENTPLKCNHTYIYPKTTIKNGYISHATDWPVINIKIQHDDDGKCSRKTTYSLSSSCHYRWWYWFTSGMKFWDVYVRHENRAIDKQFIPHNNFVCYCRQKKQAISMKCTDTESNMYNDIWV